MNEMTPPPVLGGDKPRAKKLWFNIVQPGETRTHAAKLSPFAERQILGAIFNDNQSFPRIASKLMPGDFSEELHARIFAAATELQAEKQAIGVASMAKRLGIEAIPSGPFVYLQRLFCDFDKSNGIDACIDVVKEASRERATMDVAQFISSELQAGKSATEVVAEATAWLAKIGKPQASDRSAFEMFADIELEDAEEYLVDEVLPLKGLAALYGPSGKGKSFAVIDMAMCIARGVSFAGRFECERGSVVYCPIEGREGARKRLVAYRQDHGVEACPFAIVDYKLDVCDPDSVAGFVQVLEDWKDDHGSFPSLVIVDTLNRAMPGRKENAPEDMGAAIAGMAAIQDVTGGVVLAVHHTGKDEAKGMRGHSSFYAALECVLTLRGEEGQPVELFLEKLRDGEDHRQLGTFELEEKVVGTTKKGKPKLSCVVRWNEDPVPSKRTTAKAPPPSALKALHELHELFIDGNITIAGPNDHAPEGTRMVSFSHWRTACREAQLSTLGKEDAERKAFDRALTVLEKANRIARHGDHVWMLKGT